MMFKIASLAAFAAGASALAAPGYDGFHLVWSDTFDGNSGSLPNTGNWNIVQSCNNANGELECYTNSNRNLQLSGGSTLQIVPWRDSSAQQGWTSGRLESTYTWTPGQGAVTRIESQIRFGTNDPSVKQGIWPAWWALGNSIRTGGGWPACGEIDVLETVDGQLVGHGTLHCDVNPGGICNESNGLGEATNIPNQDWHTWRVDIDKTDGNFVNQAIRWSMDGQVYHTVTGAQIGDPNVWNSVANSPFFFILNVAVGGAWPGYPNDSTQDGFGSMMEVGYVAHYST